LNLKQNQELQKIKPKVARKTKSLAASITKLSKNIDIAAMLSLFWPK